VQAALVAGTRTNRARRAQIRRTVNAALRESAEETHGGLLRYWGDDVTDPEESEQDTTRDYAAEEAEALAAQRQREADAVEQQRQRE